MVKERVTDALERQKRVQKNRDDKSCNALKLSSINQCPICGRMFDSQRGLHMHFTLSACYTSGSPGGDSRKFCSLCNELIPTKLLVKHTDVFHNSGKGEIPIDMEEDEIEFGGEGVQDVAVDGNRVQLGENDGVQVVHERVQMGYEENRNFSPLSKLEIGFLKILSKNHVVISNETAEEIITWRNIGTRVPVIRSYSKLKATINQTHVKNEQDLCKKACWNGSKGLRTFSYEVTDRCGEDVTLIFRVRDLTSVILEILNRDVNRKRGFQMRFMETQDEDDESRSFGEIWTADDWKKKEARLKQRYPDSWLIYCILYIDETTRRTGGSHAQTYTPLLLTLGNIPLDTRVLDSGKSLLGFLPKMKNLDAIVKHTVLQKYLKDAVVSQFKEVYANNGFQWTFETINDGGNQMFRAVPVLGLILGDRPMRCAMVCVMDKWDGCHPCPACNIAGKRLDEVNIDIMEAMRSLNKDASTKNLTDHSEEEDEEEIEGTRGEQEYDGLEDEKSGEGEEE